MTYPTRTPSLEERIETIEAELGVVRTLHQYAHAIDYGDMGALEDCYLPDSRQNKNLPMGDLVGRSEIMTFYRSRPTAPDKFEKHCVVNPVVTVVDHGEATASAYYFLIQDRPTGPFVSHYGRYRDQLVRGADLRWRFKVRHFDGEAIAPGMRSTGERFYRSAELVGGTENRLGSQRDPAQHLARLTDVAPDVREGS